MDKEKNPGNCFSFIWKIENARYSSQKGKNPIVSPTFAVDQINKTKWRLLLYPRYDDNQVRICLGISTDPKEVANVEIYYDIAILTPNGTILNSVRCSEKRTFCNENSFGSPYCVKREDVLSARMSARDTLTIRCRIWKTVGEISENIKCVAYTRIKVEKISFKWSIEKFSCLLLRKCYAIKSPKNSKLLMYLALSPSSDANIDFLINPRDERIKYFTFYVSAIDAVGNTIVALSGEKFCFPQGSPEVKKMMMENKYVNLPNDVLSLKCKFVMSIGTKAEGEIEEVSDCSAEENDGIDKEGILFASTSVLNESYIELLNQETDSSFFKRIFTDTLQSMINGGSLSDVKLRTSTRTYPAHMFILSARSPVFKAMFSSERKQKVNGYINIDLDDDTVSRLLLYIYSSKVAPLDWKSAKKLYEGAKKYQILPLKDICSSHLKSNLSLANACEALVLADLHRDEGLKSFVQSFILKRSKIIMNSEEWGNMMKTNVQLAAETMHLKFKK